MGEVKEVGNLKEKARGTGEGVARFLFEGRGRISRRLTLRPPLRRP